MKAASVYFDAMNRYFGVIVRVTTSCYNTSCEIIADQFYIHHSHTGFKNGKSVIPRLLLTIMMGLMLEKLHSFVIPLLFLPRYVSISTLLLTNILHVYKSS